MEIAAAAKLLQSCLTLCDPVDGSPPGSAVPEILQARTLECCHFLLQCVKVKSESEVAQYFQYSSTLRNPMDCSPLGSSVHGIFQARVLEWVAIAFSVVEISQTENRKLSCGRRKRNGLKFGEGVTFGRKTHLGGKKEELCSVQEH